VTENMKRKEMTLNSEKNKDKYR